MTTYTVHGYTTGGWDVDDTTTSLRKAMAIARQTMGGFSADSSSHVNIARNGVIIKAWSGTTAGKWVSVTV